LLGKYSNSPQPGALTLTNGTYEQLRLHSYSTALLSSFYDSDASTVLPIMLAGSTIELPFLSHAGTRIYYLVLARRTPEPVQFEFSTFLILTLRNDDDLSFAGRTNA